jgi:hypothetical protein
LSFVLFSSLQHNKIPTIIEVDIAGRDKQADVPSEPLSRLPQDGAYPSQSKPNRIEESHLDSINSRAVNTSYFIPQQNKGSLDNLCRENNAILSAIDFLFPAESGSLANSSELPAISRTVLTYKECDALESRLYSLATEVLSPLTSGHPSHSGGQLSAPSSILPRSSDNQPGPGEVGVIAGKSSTAAGHSSSDPLDGSSSSPSDSPPSPSPLWGRSPRRRSRSPAPRHRWSGSASPSSPAGDSDSGEESDSDYLRCVYAICHNFMIYQYIPASTVKNRTYFWYSFLLRRLFFISVLHNMNPIPKILIYKKLFSTQ